MKKRFYLALSTIAIGTMLSMPVFAGSWKQDNAGWWYERDDKSFPVSTWEQIDDSWYYFNEHGYILYNQWFGNYYLSSTGAMLTNTIIDGYQVGADGAYIPSSQQSGGSTQTVDNDTSTTNDTTSAAASTVSSGPTKSINNKAAEYILNKNSHVFHYSSCMSVKKMKESNKIPFSGARDEAISRGFRPCQICNP